MASSLTSCRPQGFAVEPGGWGIISKLVDWARWPLSGLLRVEIQIRCPQAGLKTRGCPEDPRPMNNLVSSNWPVGRSVAPAKLKNYVNREWLPLWLAGSPDYWPTVRPGRQPQRKTMTMMALDGLNLASATTMAIMGTSPVYSGSLGARRGLQLRPVAGESAHNWIQTIC